MTKHHHKIIQTVHVLLSDSGIVSYHFFIKSKNDLPTKLSALKYLYVYVRKIDFF